MLFTMVIIPYIDYDETQLITIKYLSTCWLLCKALLFRITLTWSTQFLLHCRLLRSSAKSDLPRSCSFLVLRKLIAVSIPYLCSFSVHSCTLLSKQLMKWYFISLVYIIHAVDNLVNESVEPKLIPLTFLFYKCSFFVAL